MKAFFTAALAVLAAPLMAQTLSQDFETDFDRNVISSKCWDVPGTSPITANVIAGKYSYQTGQLTGGITSPNGVATPWLKLKPGGAISAKVKLATNLSNGANRKFFVAIEEYSAGGRAKPANLLAGKLVEYELKNTTVVNVAATIPANLDPSKAYKVVLYFYGTGGNNRGVIDDLSITGEYWSDPANKCAPKVEVPVTTEVTYPMSGVGTLLFEDLWPAKGDYDFNDLVVDYNIKATITGGNQVKKAIFTFTTRAAGSTFKNGFALQLDGVPTSLVAKVSGGDKAGFSVSGNGTESGQKYANFPVYVNVFKYLPQPGGGTGSNVTPGAPVAKPHTTVITVEFNDGLSLEVFNNSFNPYLIVNGERDKEVHLANKQPSAQASSKYFNTSHDNSNPAAGRYYRTSQNLPWALNTPVSVPHTRERADITSGYLRLLDWAQSNGAKYADWYLPNGGYREKSNLMD